MQPNIIERALQLAAECASIKELRQKLRDEGFTLMSIDMHLVGLGFRRQLQTRFNAGAGLNKRGPKPR
jgi:hypothetical protein